MRKISSIAATIFVVVCYMSAPSKAQSDINLESYTCLEFVNDAVRPGDPDKFFRSLMMISWATGFAAAHQKDNPRSDGAAFRLIGATLGHECKTNPQKKAVEAIIEAVRQFEKP